MAVDAYVYIESVKGESTDSKHQGWLECLSVHWGVTQPRSPVASTAGGHTVGRAEMDDVTFVKYADLSSPTLMQLCASGKTLPKVKFEFFRADGSGERVKYFEMELFNVLVGHVEADLHPGDLMAEHVGLKYSRVTYRYTQQKVNGGAGGSTVGGWNLATNSIE
jgi:type VI secretion system secreted protein Hcp